MEATASPDDAKHPVDPKPVILSCLPWVAEGITGGSIPWEFRKRRSGHEPGTRVFTYASGKVRGIIGTYLVGTVFAYETLAQLVEGIRASEMARYDQDGINQDWLKDIYDYLPAGWAFEILNAERFEIPLSLGLRLDGSKARGPQGFQYLDFTNPAHVALWQR